MELRCIAPKCTLAFQSNAELNKVYNLDLATKLSATSIGSRNRGHNIFVATRVEARVTSDGSFHLEESARLLHLLGH